MGKTDNKGHQTATRGQIMQTRPLLALAPAIPVTCDPPVKNRHHTNGFPTLKGENKGTKLASTSTTAPTSTNVMEPKIHGVEFDCKAQNAVGHVLAMAPHVYMDVSSSCPVDEASDNKSNGPCNALGSGAAGPVGNECDTFRPYYHEQDDVVDRDGATKEDDVDGDQDEPTLVVAAQVVSNEDVELNFDDANIETKIQQEVETRLKMQNQNVVVVDAVVAIKPSAGTEGTPTSTKHAKEVEQKMFGLTRRVWYWLLFVLLLLAGVAIGVVVAGQGSVDSVDLRNEILKGYEDRSPFENSTSPQSRALEWLSTDTFSLSEGNLTAKVLERYALAVFYFSTDGPNWARDLPFLSETDACSWNNGWVQSSRPFGVFCEDGPFVDLIRFDDAGLVGTIPWELSYLSDMEALRLDENSLIGTLPTELGKLSALIGCNLANNSFTGTLPTEFGPLTNLVKLTVNESYFIGSLPTELGLLTNMTELDITGNMFSGTIPAELGTCTSLDKFAASSNNLFGSLPSELGMWTALTLLDVSNNSLNGTLSTNLGAWTNLASFKASGNKIIGSLPTELGQWTNLKVFSMQGNGITGTLPTEFGDWNLVEEFSVSDNSIEGSITTELGNFSALRSFQVATNALDGTLPTELGQLTSLTILDVGFNALNGTLPTELGRMRALQSFYVNTNSLSGTLPTELGRMVALVTVDVSTNLFTGTLPTELSDLNALTNFSFGQNNFTGSVDDIFCIEEKQWDVLAGDCIPNQGDIECSCCTNC